MSSTYIHVEVEDYDEDNGTGYVNLREFLENAKFNDSLQEIADYLKRNKIDAPTEFRPLSIIEEEWFSLSEKLWKSHPRLTLEEEQIIKQIISKYE